MGGIISTPKQPPRPAPPAAAAPAAAAPTELPPVAGAALNTSNEIRSKKKKRRTPSILTSAGGVTGDAPGEKKTLLGG